jgi:hypothetical protein
VSKSLLVKNVDILEILRFTLVAKVLCFTLCFRDVNRFVVMSQIKRKLCIEIKNYCF